MFCRVLLFRGGGRHLEICGRSKKKKLFLSEFEALAQVFYLRLPRFARKTSYLGLKKKTRQSLSVSSYAVSECFVSQMKDG